MTPFYITKEGLEELKQQLATLKTSKRQEIAARLKRALEQGDLSENAEYQDAKDEQAWLEGKIAELDSKIKNAQIISKDKNGNISIGSQIKIKNGGKALEYTIVGSQEANPAEGKISNESPIGMAFLGHKKGEKVKVQTPDGFIEYKILQVS
ncbi:MAG: transcription elongation factor GreA [Patescibacteria group bacterium]|nr:transcription elongation factor GreA [Patescibacteria group bacterium]